MHGRDVQAALSLRPGAAETGAEGDVRGGVLVEQRVEVRAARLADPRCRIDERYLADPAALAGRVAVDVGGDEVASFVVVGFETDEPAVRELPAQPVDALALEGQRERAGERPVGS